MKYGSILLAFILAMSLTSYTQTRSSFGIDSNTVALWHFDEGAGNVLYDASPYHNDGEIINPVWVNGKYGSAIHFDANRTYVKLPNSPSLKQEKEFTIEAWISLDTLGFPYDPRYPDKVYVILSNEGAYPNGGGYQLSYHSQHDLAFEYKAINPIVEFSGGVELIQTRNFYHVAVTYERTQLGNDSVTIVKTYLDGVQKDSVAFSQKIQYSNTPYFYIGTNIEGKAVGGWKLRDFLGVIDEIRISNVARHPEEFDTPYLATSTGKLDFGFVEVGASLTQQLMLTNTSNVDTLMIDGLTISNDKFSVTHHPGSVLPNGQVIIHVTYAPTDAGVDVGTMTIFVPNEGIPETKIQLLGKSYSGNIDTNVVAHWHFDEGEGTVLHDASIYGNDGTIHNSEWITGKKGNALHFDGRTSYVVLPNSPSLKQEQAFTIEAWVSFDTLDFNFGYNERHATIVSNLGPYPYGGGYQMDIMTGGWYEFDYRAGSPISNFSKKTRLTSTHRYYHLAAVYERVFLNPDTMTVVKTFVDGIMTDSSTFRQTIHYTSTDKFYLGTNRDGRAAGSYGVRELPGILDEVKISKVARHPNEFGLARLALSKQTIPFPPVRLGGSVSEQITVVNISSGDSITVNDIQISNAEFSTGVSSFTLPPRGEQTVTITYTPVDIGSDEGFITFIPTDSAFESAELFVNGRGYAIGEAPQITSIIDVPNDQGRQVRIIWYPSIYDSQSESLRVHEYSIWRKVNDPLLKSFSAIHEGIINVIGNKRYTKIQGELWDFITALPAVRFEQYAFVAPTLYNTNEYREHWSTFRVAAHTTTGEFFFSSADSGASHDNVFPVAPRLLSVTPVLNRVYLIWSEVEEPDLYEYRIYRSTKREFDAGSTVKLGKSTFTSYEDNTVLTNERYYYAVTSVDSNGNESLEKRISDGIFITGIGNSEELPPEYQLHQNYPNPFNPSTIISFALPERSSVTLVVYDILGKPVATLIEQAVEAGYHDLQWVAPQASGMYIYKLSAISVDNPANTFIQSKKMLFIK
ncbi:MAG: choice-of-anchor D domain-containing protein [Ignavibacteriae bacterium]|nr:choice-of-anchor D domain-containing protein [Ignavibacteriota bacterium]